MGCKLSYLGWRGTAMFGNLWNSMRSMQAAIAIAMPSSAADRSWPASSRGRPCSDTCDCAADSHPEATCAWSSMRYKMHWPRRQTSSSPVRRWWRYESSPAADTQPTLCHISTLKQINLVTDFHSLQIPERALNQHPVEVSC